MLDAQRFLVKERVKFLQGYASYDIFNADAEDSVPVGTAEEQISTIKQLVRWFVSKALLGTRIEVREKPDDALVFTISRSWYILRGVVEVRDSQGELVGTLRSKVLTIGGGFHVYAADGRHFAEVKGNLIGFNYRILTPDRSVELGQVSKSWGGVAKELFTSADTYAVTLNDDLQEQPLAKMLVLAAALAVDMIFKSESRTAGSDLLGEI